MSLFRLSLTAAALGFGLGFIGGPSTAVASAPLIVTGGADLDEVLAIQRICFKATEGESVDLETFLVRGWTVSTDDGQGRRKLNHPDHKAEVVLASTDNESCVVMAPAGSSQAQDGYMAVMSELTWRPMDNGSYVATLPHRIIGVGYTSGARPTLRVHTIIRKEQSE